ncbi:TonB-dependent receptor [Prevotella sp. E13-17]|uniref:TonB-dependent receptor plug domain-containing protein n=1 Tax=Prevotella sp. E13-17 TaxID=2913616 RepID=UPI001EDBADAA|nr:TonB-dependent receptor [Prevotella sp. E13-17]UKK51712.1 TonB-dependent receptor [Prevotella sp. E13-17]
MAALLLGSAAFSQVHQMARRDTFRIAHSYDLNPVVVTGSGHHQRLKSTSTPVHVLSKREIQEQGITTIEDALVRMMPQVSMAPNSMGNFLELNGLGNKYILILINGQKLGDASASVDLQRIDMARVKRIEILDGAASSLYGSDAIGGVINIITDQPAKTDVLPVGITSSSRVSGEGKMTESVTLDVYKNGFGSYTSFTHDRADSYQTYTEKYQKGSTTLTEPTIAPLFTGYRSNLVSQKFTYSPSRQLAMNAGFEYNHKITDRPNTRADITGGTDYEMRYKGLRWNVGGIYKFDAKNSIQADVTIDRFRYGKEYDVPTNTYEVGDYVQSKKQRTIENQLKAILSLVPQGTTIVGSDWRLDKLIATSGSINEESYILAYYAQHEQRFLDHFTATVGARYDYHKSFGNHFTPKLSLMGSFGNVNLRATYSAGFRAPGLEEIYYHYYSVNRGKPQITFGNKELSPEKSNYLSLNAEYRTRNLAVSLTGFWNSIWDMVVRRDIDVTSTTLTMLQAEFPEMTATEAAALTRYSIYQNSDRGDVKGLQMNVSANVLEGLNLSVNYACTYARSKSGSDWTILDRSIRNAATMAVSYHHTWRHYTLNVNLNGRLQSKTYYSAYENAPGYGLWNLQTTHSFMIGKHLLVEPSLGVDNILDKIDARIDSTNRKYALFSPGRRVVAGLLLKF